MPGVFVVATGWLKVESILKAVKNEYPEGDIPKHLEAVKVAYKNANVSVFGCLDS